MSAVATARAAAPVPALPYAEALLHALDAAVPVIPRDVHRITVQYAVSRWVDWDFETCLQAKGYGGKEHRLTRPFAPEPSTAHLCSASAVPAAHWSLDIVPGSFLFVVSKSTLGESGLDRWAVRMDRNECWSHGIGVCAISPAEALAMSKSPVGSIQQVIGQERRFVLLGTHDMVFQSAATISNGGSSPGGGGAPPFAVPPPGAVLHEPINLTNAHGAVFTFEVDRKANTLRVQTHYPGGGGGGGVAAYGGPRPAAGSEPGPEDRRMGRVPSVVVETALPRDMPWSCCRPALVLWGRGVTVSEVEPSAAFPLTGWCVPPVTEAPVMTK
jgi:hypothetical protein